MKIRELRKQSRVSPMVCDHATGRRSRFIALGRHVIGISALCLGFV
jgi:hypothetical protein